ncbi:hypothetical protein AB0I84_34640 [Streptomyces spectabilis]|uniref:hypothetical protein n=1 Tax=Streptomyces spectabilis TaxID=68270 RepID=UPI0033EE09AE
MTLQAASAAASAAEPTARQLAPFTGQKLTWKPCAANLPATLKAPWRPCEPPKQVTERYDLIGFDPRGVGGSTPVTCGLGGIRDLMRAQFVKVRQSAELVVKLKKAASGQSVPPGPAAPPAAPPGDNAAVSQWAVVCADGSDWPRDVETYHRDVVRDSARYPLYGDFVSGISPCAYWPRAAEAAGPVSNRVPALIVQN